MTTTQTIDRTEIRAQRKALQRVIDAIQDEITKLRGTALRLTESLEALQEECHHIEEQWYIDTTAFIESKRCADCHKHLGV
jgi:hypothetical protein